MERPGIENPWEGEVGFFHEWRGVRGGDNFVERCS